MVVAGVDPGRTGGIVVVSASKGGVLQICQSKKMSLKRSGKSTVLDESALRDYVAKLSHWFPTIRAVIEKPLVARICCKKSIATQWDTYGFTRGVLGCYIKEVDVITPMSWQSLAYKDCPPELVGKQRSYWAARKIYGPDYDLEPERRDGEADASLIAWYWLRNHFSEWL